MSGETTPPWRQIARRPCRNGGYLFIECPKHGLGIGTELRSRAQNPRWRAAEAHGAADHGDVIPPGIRQLLAQPEKLDLGTVENLGEIVERPAGDVFRPQSREPIITVARPGNGPPRGHKARGSGCSR